MNKVIRSRPYYKGLNRDRQSPTQDNKLTYIKGQIVEADGLNEDPNNDCGRGINFCSTVAAALRWGPLVVEVWVPEGKRIIDTGSKLRAKRVVVGDDVSLRGANLRGAYLRGADLCGADLRGADLCGANLGGAYLDGANLTGAILTGANLTGSSLTGASLTAASLGGAYVENTIIDLPPGWKIENGLIVRDV